MFPLGKALLTSATTANTFLAPHICVSACSIHHTWKYLLPRCSPSANTFMDGFASGATRSRSLDDIKWTSLIWRPGSYCEIIVRPPVSPLKGLRLEHDWRCNMTFGDCWLNLPVVLCSPLSLYPCRGRTYVVELNLHCQRLQKQFSNNTEPLKTSTQKPVFIITAQR